ncbi:30S ribosomal protein S9 [Candidatus Wolfebacteria bacterium]|nr:30S ribosomal protein S9 [Candidatus Wolfebacteria bacterium]
MVEKKLKIEKKTKKEKESAIKPERYFEAVGRRKTAVARVRLFTKKTDIEANGKDLEIYFPTLRLQRAVTAPFDKMKIADKLGASIKLSGGGISAQAEAASLGISRALVKFNADFRKRLKRFGHLTRDSRAVERKKYGLKKARRAPQWKKR